tara:strand:+ start:373 stop:531 length:159 start_codon:yes stop_codon:yes gene_type:complete
MMTPALMCFGFKAPHVFYKNNWEEIDALKVLYFSRLAMGGLALIDCQRAAYP